MQAELKEAKDKSDPALQNDISVEEQLRQKIRSLLPRLLVINGFNKDGQEIVSDEDDTDGSQDSQDEDASDDDEDAEGLPDGFDAPRDSMQSNSDDAMDEDKN